MSSTRTRNRKSSSSEELQDDSEMTQARLSLDALVRQQKVEELLNKKIEIDRQVEEAKAGINEYTIALEKAYEQLKEAEQASIECQTDIANAKALWQSSKSTYQAYLSSLTKSSSNPYIKPRNNGLVDVNPLLGEIPTKDIDLKSDFPLSGYSELDKYRVGPCNPCKKSGKKCIRLRKQKSDGSSILRGCQNCIHAHRSCVWGEGGRIRFCPQKTLDEVVTEHSRNEVGATSPGQLREGWGATDPQPPNGGASGHGMNGQAEILAALSEMSSSLLSKQEASKNAFMVMFQGLENRLGALEQNRA
ncbi:hypothetical protein CPB86DRAFT_565627 [Serendipita vermifera]|nr:hypothetical protein CPB86DRAFT_565627 [Serendipita vermifera]